MDIQPDPAWQEAGILVVGHGARSQPRAVADTRAHAARLRDLGWFGEVETGFFAGGIGPGDALAAMTSETVYIIPHFMGAGYFVRQALPESIESASAGRHCYICAPPSMHSEFPDVVTGLVAEAADAADMAQETCRVVLAAHGSDTNTASADHTRWVRDRLDGFGDLEVGYLEQAPRLDAVLRAGDRPTVVAGLFAAHGSHAIDDVAAAIESASTGDDGPNIVYTGAIGASPRMTPLMVGQIAALDASGGRVAGLP